jgi:hypothetical protein
VCGTPSLTRRRACSLQLLLDFSSLIILGSEFSGTSDHILLSQIRDLPNFEGYNPRILSPSYTPRLRIPLLSPHTTRSSAVEVFESVYMRIFCMSRRSKVEVTLRLTVNRSVCLGIEHPCRSWPNITFCAKVVVWKFLSCLCRAPSVTRGRVCHLPSSVYSNLSVFTSSIYVTCVLQISNLYTIYTKLYSVPSEYNRLCSTSNSLPSYESICHNIALL